MPLAVPTQPARPAGTRLTGAIYQADVTNGVLFAVNPPLFVGTQGTIQAVAATTWVAASLDTSQVDSYAGHSNSTNNSRYTAQVAGWYTVCGMVAFANNGTGVRASRIQVNGNPIAGACAFTVGSGSNSLGVPTPTRDVFLAVGDYVEVAGWQNSGAALNTSVNSDLSSALWVRWSHA